MNEVTGDWWSELHAEVLGCLAHGAMTPAEVGRRLGMSEAGAASLLSMLAGEGKVRISLVELTPETATTEPRAA